MKNEKKIESKIAEEKKMEIEENPRNLNTSFSIDQIFKKAGI